MIILCSTGALTHLATPQESRESMRSKAGIDADASMGEEGESKAAGGRGDVRMDGVPAFDDSWLAVPAKQVEPHPPPPSTQGNRATARILLKDYSGAAGVCVWVCLCVCVCVRERERERE